MARTEDVLAELETMGVLGDFIGDIDLTVSVPMDEGQTIEQSVDIAVPVEQTVSVPQDDPQVFDFSALCTEAMQQLDAFVESAKQLRRTFSVLAEATGRHGDNDA